MRTWKEVIKEASAAEIRRAGEAALRDERKKNKEEKTQKANLLIRIIWKNNLNLRRKNTKHKKKHKSKE